MVEEKVQQWVQGGGKGIPIVLLPIDWIMDLAADRVFVHTARVSKPIVTAIDTGLSLVYGSLTVEGEEDDE